jgi:hypothetical protein
VKTKGQIKRGTAWHKIKLGGESVLMVMVMVRVMMMMDAL